MNIDFSKAKTLQEVVALSQQLKLAGADVAKVNWAASARKRELITENVKASSLEKVDFIVAINEQAKVMNIPLESNGEFSKPYIIVKENGMITI